MNYVGSYGTATPQVSESVRAADRAFDRIDLLAREQAAKEKARAAGLNDYAPNLDEVWDRDQQEIVGDLKGYREESLDWYQKGSDINDPSNADAYTWNRNRQSEIDSKIAMTAQHKALWGEASKALSGKDAEMYDPESWVRLNEFFDAGSIKERQGVLDRYDGQLIIQRPFDAMSWLGGMVPKPETSSGVRRGTIPGTREEFTTTQVTGDQLKRAASSVVTMANAGDWKAQAAIKAIRTSYESLAAPVRESFLAQAEKLGLSEDEFHAYRTLEGLAPGAVEKVVSKNNPRPTGGATEAGTKFKQELPEAERLVLMFAGAINGDGAEWEPVETGRNIPAGIDGMTQPDAQLFPMGLPIGQYTTVLPGEDGAKQAAYPNILQGFYKIDGRLYYQTSESLASYQTGTTSRKGIKIGSIAGLMPVQGGDADWLLRAVAEQTKSTSFAAITHYINQRGARYPDINDPNTNWATFTRSGSPSHLKGSGGGAPQPQVGDKFW